MRLLVLFGSCALLGAGVLVGMSLESVESSRVDGSEADDEGVVVVDIAHGTERLTAEEAASRIELLEATIRRRRLRDTRMASAEDGESAGEGEARADPLPPPLRRPDGKPYSLAELRELALSSDDPDLRRRAIRAMRWHDSDEARNTLEELLGNDELSQEERLEAARALARPPHRDKLPEKLIALIGEEEDPEIRAALAQGIARLRERGAWMSEISAILDKETDPSVRKEIFRAVARSSRDPAARQELLDIVAASSGTAEERQMAIRALTRGKPDAATLAAVAPLLDDNDPVVRGNALRILASGRKLGLGDLQDVLGDADPTVRAQALWHGARLLPRLGKGKNAKNPEYQAAVRQVIEIAAHDTDAGVRRAAINRVWSLPKKERGKVLETGRADADPFVRLTAYASSGRRVARTATPDFLGALDSQDRGMRDFAYRQLRRLHGVDVPYNAGWNDKARASAADEIRRTVHDTWKPE